MQSPSIDPSIQLPPFPRDLPSLAGPWKKEAFDAATKWVDEARPMIPADQALVFFIHIQTETPGATATDAPIVEEEKHVRVVHISTKKQVMQVRRVDTNEVISVGYHPTAIKILGMYYTPPMPSQPAQQVAPQTASMEQAVSALTESLRRQNVLQESHNQAMIALQQQLAQAPLQQQQQAAPTADLLAKILTAQETANVSQARQLEAEKTDAAIKAAAQREHEEKMRAIQERMMKAEEENAVRQAKIEKRKHDTVYMSKVKDLEIANLPGLTDEQLGWFEDLAFPPMDAPATSGFTTALAVTLAHHAIHEGLRITAKESELKKLIEEEPKLQHLYNRVLLCGGKAALTPTDPKFDRFSVFFIGLEGVIRSKRWAHTFHDDKGKELLRKKLTAAYGIKQPTRVTVDSEKVRLNVISHDTLPTVSIPNPFNHYGKNVREGKSECSSHFYQREQNVKLGGGGSQEPPQRVGENPPRFPELAAGAMISASLLDAVLRQLNEALGRKHLVIFPNNIRSVASSKERLDKVVNSAMQHFDGLLAPLLVQNDHWILIHGAHHQGIWNLTVYDSLPTHTKQEASEFVRLLKESNKNLKNAYVRYAHNVIQSPRSNDCALYVMRAATQVLLRLLPTETESLYQRKDLDDIFRRIVNEKGGPFPMTLSSSQKVALQAAFRVHAQQHAPKTVAPNLNVIDTENEEEPIVPDRLKKMLTTKGASPVVAIRAASHLQQRKSTQSSQADQPQLQTLQPAPEQPNAEPPQPREWNWRGAPRVVFTCPHVTPSTKQKCGKIVKKGQGVSCSGCATTFCAKHFNSEATKKPNWLCPECKDSARWQVACAFPGCTKDHGMIKIGQGRVCMECTQSFHHIHHKVPKGEKFICTSCRSGRERQPPEGDYSMAIDEERDNMDFQQGQGSPCLASRQGALEVVEAIKVSLNPRGFHPLADKGLHPATREAHMRALRALTRLPFRCRNWPFVTWALELLERERRHGNKGKGKTWTTTNTWLGHIAGALARLPMYTRGRMNPISISLDPEWRDGATMIARLARQHANTGLPAITAEEVWRAIEKTEDPKIKAALLINWLCMARMGDTLQLQTEGVTVTMEPQKPPHLLVYYCEGKVIGRGRVDPYHISTTMPEHWAMWLKTYMSTVKTKHLFHMSTLAERERYIGIIREHLRKIHPRLDCRSVRRGALQTFAALPGVTLQHVLHFSKHTDLPMLRRYLKYGKAPNDEMKKVTPLTVGLWPADSSISAITDSSQAGGTVA